MTGEVKVSEPVSAELRALSDEARWVRAANDGPDGELVTYVTEEFHEAMLAELRARWERDVAELRGILEILQS